MARQRRGLSTCRELLAQCCDAADNGRWKRLENSRNDYMAAFERLKGDISQTGLDDEDLSLMRGLEREQQRLVRLIHRRQDYIREQLDVLGDVRQRLLHTQGVAQAIEEGRL